MPSPFWCEPEPLVSARLQEEPLAFARSERMIRGSLTFYATLTLPFFSEGGVEYARLPSVGTSGDIFGELLLGKSEWRPVPRSLGVG